MSGAFDYVELDVIEIFSQADSTFLIHPITISEKDVDINLYIHSSQNLLNASDWLQRPIEKCIKSTFTCFIDAYYVLQIFLPC